MKKAIFLLIMSATIFSFVGCGSNASATSGTSSVTTDKVVTEKVEDKVETVKPEATEENEKLNNELTSKDETEIQEPNEAATSRPETNASINWEDFLDGNTWNLTAYAEALGYTWMQDPEYITLVMYNIRHGDNNYFVTYFDSCVFVFLGTDHGCWLTDGIITASGNFDILVASTAQDETYVPLETVEQIAGIFSYIAGDDVDLTKIPSHAAYTLKHTLEPAQYFNNGLIRQRELDEVVDYQFCGN